MTEPNRGSPLEEAVQALRAEFVHPGKMKEKLIHYLHAHEAQSEFARSLKIEDCIRRGESLYSQRGGSHHRTKCEQLLVPFRRYGLLLY